MSVRVSSEGHGVVTTPGGGSLKQTVDQIDVAGQRVLVRVDFNVPMEAGRILDDRRIRAALPTIVALRSRGARVILVTHLGRPKGRVDPAYSVAPIADRLADLLHSEVRRATDVVGPSARAVIAALNDGDVAILENVRFEPGEERNDPDLAVQLSTLADVFVNDAFGTAHRAHASTEGIAHHLPACAGYLMARELEVLGRLLDAPAHPVVSILGGSKISSKLGVLENLRGRVDTLWIGGAMACTFFRALGQETGASLVESDQVAVARALLDANRPGLAEIRLPLDVVVAASRSADAPTEVVSWKSIPADRMVVDIGPETVKAIAVSCAGAATIVWNGPLGIYEIPTFAGGTHGVAEAVAAAAALSIVGGGDLAAAIEDAGVADRIGFISTGGGATLEFLEGRSLPGVVALTSRSDEPRGTQGRPAAAAARRIPLVAGNWKMNTGVEQGMDIARRLVAELAGIDAETEVAVLPPFTHLWALRAEFAGAPVALGAQDAFWEDGGAYTGEIAPAMLDGLCEFVLIGHSERRALGETDDQVNRKLRLSLTHRLRVIVAVGETLDQYEAGATKDVVERQVAAAFSGVLEGDLARVVIAYEPVWAIGTGRTATPDVAQFVCQAIRNRLAVQYTAAAAAAMRVLYGGSVTPANAAELFAQPDIDGGLIGGASLKPSDFGAIVRAAAPVAGATR